MPKVQTQNTQTKLNATDLAYLNERERIVKHGSMTREQVAIAIHEIHTYKNGLLWRREFKSFEAYVKARWPYHRSHVFRLLKFGQFLSDLKQQSSLQKETIKAPTKEAHARPFLEILRREHWVGAWNAYILETESPTSKTAAAFCAKVAKSQGLEAPTESEPILRLRAATLACKSALTSMNPLSDVLSDRMKRVTDALEKPSDLVVKPTHLAAASKALAQLKALLPGDIPERVKEHVDELDQLLHPQHYDPWKPQAEKLRGALREFASAIRPITRRARILIFLKEFDEVLIQEARAKTQNET